jgi:hypothetical protein
MKHLKRFNESKEDEKLDILDNFAYITDKFGQPNINSSNYGTGTKWNISWDIKLNLSVLQEATQLIQKLKDIVEEIDDVLSAADRLENYNINMSLTSELRIELVPKDTGDDTFKFIKGYESRALYVRINEVERFFNSRGLRVVKWDNESSYDEVNQNNKLEISLNKVDNQVTAEFYRLVMAELNLIKDRDYQMYTNGNDVVIYPDEEKAYIEVFVEKTRI